MNQSKATRRSLLKVATGATAYGIGAASIAGIASVTSCTDAKAATVDRAAWDRAFAAFTEADAHEQAVTPAYDRVWALYEQQRPPLPKWLDNPFDTGVALEPDDIEGSLADFLSSEGRTWNGEDVKARIHARAEELRERERQIAAFETQHDFPRIEREYNDALDAATERRWVLMLMPAPDLAALHWKMEHLWGGDADRGAPNSCYSAATIAAIMGDVRRLSSAMEG